MKESFVGSTVAMFMGAISAIGQLRHWPNINEDNIWGVLTAVLGALAYRSAKQTRLGLKGATTWRRGMEFSLLLMVCFPIFPAMKETDGFVHRPWSAVLIPLWAGAAYLIIRRMKVVPMIPSIR